jgi:hypothetical protein
VKNASSLLKKNTAMRTCNEGPSPQDAKQIMADIKDIKLDIEFGMLIKAKIFT